MITELETELEKVYGRDDTPPPAQQDLITALREGPGSAKKR